LSAILSTNSRQASVLKTRTLLGIALLLVAISTIAADDKPAIPKEIQAQVDAVRRYVLEEDYPELFKDKPYRARIENLIVADIDNDNAPEVVALFNPHYRQSPTIVIFQLDKDLKVRRAVEGLAPGPLLPVTGQYLDSHGIGMAVDFTAKTKPGAKPLLPRHVVEASLKARFGSIVQYLNFFHADFRTGRRTYIDMTHLDVPGHEENCAHFEFAKVNEIAVGAVWDNDPRAHLLARVGREIYIYRIDKIDEKGFLEKHLWVAQTPPDFKSFFASYVSGWGTPFLYQTTTGEIRRLQMEGAIPMPNRSMQPTAGSGG